ncbi:MAG: hypothetical protein BZ136_02610 [Methanosphaera sp. rholeuAM74]|nr:MAG: hypothetical protein BZ136_02610 [Methanosphaera sp. rholeuAM74]
MDNVYVDQKDKDEIDEETFENEEVFEEETDNIFEEEAEEAEENVEEEADVEEETTEEFSEEEDIKFDYKEYGKETVEETKNMAEKMFNDVVATLKSKQSDWNKTLAEYKSNKPSVDLFEYDDDLVIKVDLPRVSKDDINVKMSTDSVEIEAIFPDETQDECVKVIRKERCSGKTKNIVLLPVEVDINEVKAKFEDYVLTITLPKIHGKKVDVEVL